MLIPYQVDVPMYRWPVANWVIIALTTIMYGLQMAWGPDDPVIQSLVLQGWSPLGLFGAMFLHGGILHLLGNMLFLWVFGNAICARVGNIAYPFIYVGLGLLSSVAHAAMSTSQMVGASGAINGIVGMYLIWYPLNDMTSFFWIPLLTRPKTFSLSSVWMILLWLIWDILGLMGNMLSTIMGGGHTAYWAHLGGFFAGAALAVVLTLTKRVEIDPGDRSMLDLLHLTSHKKPDVAPMFASRHRGVPIAKQEEKKPAPAMPPVELESAPETVQFSCSCGKALRAQTIHAGKRARCPVCGNSVLIPDH